MSLGFSSIALSLSDYLNHITTLSLLLNIKYYFDYTLLTPNENRIATKRLVKHRLPQKYIAMKTLILYYILFAVMFVIAVTGKSS